MYRCFTVVLFMSVIIASLFAAGTDAQTPAANITTDTTQSTPVILPVQAFTKYDEFGGIKLSPSGKYAVFMTGKYGRSRLVFITMKDKKVISSVSCSEDFEFDDDMPVVLEVDFSEEVITDDFDEAPEEEHISETTAAAEENEAPSKAATHGTIGNSLPVIG